MDLDLSSTLAGVSASAAIPLRHRSLTSPGKAVYQGKFPLTAEFRSGPRGYKKSYEDWVEHQLMPHGHAVDLQTNVLRFEPENWEYANRFAAEHPETMVLSTWRAASGMPKGVVDGGDPLGESTISFPGHWVLSPGTTLVQGINPTSEIVQVASTTNMRRGPALLVETTNNGNTKLWDRFEYVLIQGVDDGANTVQVRREFNGSPAARVFPAGTTQLLPMPWDDRNRKPYTDWFFNLSDSCPRDGNGKTAMDTLLEDMVGPLREGGPLDLIAGIDLASGPLTVNPEFADYDLDGIVDEDAIYRNGVKTFYKRIREAIGQDGVLTTSLDYEFSEYINGVNQEGLANPDDPWEHVTRTVNNVLSWEKFAQLPVVGLAFQQHMDREETMLRVQLQRLLSGYSVCLGMAADVETGSGSEALDEIKRIELYKGDEAQPHWLGKAVSMSRPAAMTPNLLNGSNSNDKAKAWDTIVPSLGVKRGTLLVEEDELVLRPDEGDFAGYLTLDLNFELEKKSDFVVYMEAISDDDQLLRKILLPQISVDVEHDAARAEITSKDYLPLSFYVRGASAGTVTVGFRFEHGGDIRFRSLSVHKAADTLACEFENGVVLANPSKEDVSFDLNELFPGRRGFQRLSASVPRGAADIPDEYYPQLRQAMELNNGMRVDDTTSLSVPQRNSLFLIADSIAITDDASQENNDIDIGSVQVEETAPEPAAEVKQKDEPASAYDQTRIPESPVEQGQVDQEVTQDEATSIQEEEPINTMSTDEEAWEALTQLNEELQNEPSEDFVNSEDAIVFSKSEEAPGASQNESSSNKNLLLLGVGIMAAFAAIAIGVAGFLVRKKRSASLTMNFDDESFGNAAGVKKQRNFGGNGCGSTIRMGSCDSLGDTFHDNYISQSRSESSLGAIDDAFEAGLQKSTVRSVSHNGVEEAIEVGFREVRL